MSGKHHSPPSTARRGCWDLQPQHYCRGMDFALSNNSAGDLRGSKLRGHQLFLLNGSLEAGSPFPGSPSSQVAGDGVPVDWRAGAAIWAVFLLIEGPQEGI